MNLTANVSDNDDLGEVFQGDDRPNLAGTNLTDRLLGTVEMNILHGRESNDFIDAQGGSDRLYGRENDDYILGGDGDDKIWGGQGNDYIEGSAGNDLMFGESGSDHLLGGDGSDRLLGHKDNDYLSGDLGADTLTGGQGRDVFAISLGMDGLTLEAADVITDFNVQEDFIDLMDSATAGGLTSESLNITQGTGNYTNDLIIQHQATGEYIAILLGIQPSEISLIQFI
ncbi:calcium-binding protein [Planktothricoides raciborskii]|uniref:Calcium-binding protein n=2 Tax=Planktothricoides TaxID=132607 RepID=A0AAU8JED1_9CYAN